MKNSIKKVSNLISCLKDALKSIENIENEIDKDKNLSDEKDFITLVNKAHMKAKKIVRRISNLIVKKDVWFIENKNNVYIKWY